MKLDEALSQLSEIHAQVLRSEVFQGYRPAPMVATALLAVVAGTLQTTLLPAGNAAEYARYWVAVSAVGAAIVATDLFAVTAMQGARRFRQRTLPVLLQIAPATVAGAVVTAVLLRLGGSLPSLLPGLWSLIYGLGVAASLPYLPRAVGWVAGHYVATGCVLLALAPGYGVPSPWAMAVPFAIGQLGAALALRRARDGLLEARDG